MGFSGGTCMLVSVAFWALVLCESSDLLHCVQESNCACTMSDNSGRYDLSALSRKDKPYFNIMGRNTSERFFYDPCTPFTLDDAATGKESNCKDAAACQVEQKAHYIIIAKHFTTQFLYDPSSQQIFLKYKNEKMFHEVETEVHLRCPLESDATMLELIQATDKAVAFRLTSPHACLQPFTGLSFGSIICIIFSLCFIVYFVGGILLLVFIQNKPLSEAIPPNKDFWLDLPDLIMDGIRFTRNGFKVIPTTHQRLGGEDEDDHTFHDDFGDEDEEQKPKPSAGPPEPSDGFTAVPV